ncbi:LysR substrate-binding domain-containing protein [Spongiactinospora sp. TRM90649]|uniref:LysR substrate-binding domain-containing protein n=1 Tax=Spongiactinospora sp. TRM90649 TaxID=3031114 RepID=UPI0023F901D2|nr:LysR substrate-binding domain-containing protein [Spongiactinospora sp. TRM90649]MDF5757774.1 LysR substrate-binding domain-containing protein [Spongiactinospora sp. TRM90649]
MDLDTGTLTRLRAFEAVGRNLSFARAAQELYVTPAALSHHVRHLEEELGVPLVTRLHRRIELTAHGVRLLPECTRALGILGRAVREVKSADRQEALTVSVAPYFSARWLTPRLARFWARHPDIGLRLHHAYQPADFRDGDLDAGINWCRGDLPDVHSTPVLRGDLTMVCSPGFLRGLPARPSPRDLLGHRLMYEFRTEDLAAWFEAAGAGTAVPERAERVDDSHTLRRLALDGHGAALFFSGLIHDDLRSGALVRPFDVEVDPGSAYYLIRPKDRPIGRRLRLFTAWLMHEIATDPYV